MATVIREPGKDPAAVLSDEGQQSRPHIFRMNSEFGKQEEIEPGILTMCGPDT